MGHGSSSDAPPPDPPPLPAPGLAPPRGTRLKYDEPLGAAHGVVAYSNGSDSSFSAQKHYVKGIFTGYRWQCVEYARRFLIETSGVTFPSIPNAVNIWDVPALIPVAEGVRHIPLLRVPNGSSPHLPPVGSLLIYGRGLKALFGHVAVVVGVNGERVQVAEQNWEFRSWGDQGYARELPVTRDAEGRASLRCPHARLIGWLVPVPPRPEFPPPHVGAEGAAAAPVLVDSD